MIHYLRYLVLLLVDRRRCCLYLASRIPENKRTRQSLLKPVSSPITWVPIIVFIPVLILIVAFFRLGWGLPGFFIMLIPTALGLFFISTLGHYYGSVYGNNRGEVLRYAFYAEKPEFSSPGQRRLLLRADLNQTFNKNLCKDWNAVRSRGFWLVALYFM